MKIKITLTKENKIIFVGTLQKGRIVMRYYENLMVPFDVEYYS